MVNFRNTAILGGILLVLAGYFYVFEYDGNTGPEAETVFNINQEQVTGVTITLDDETTVAEKIPRVGWQIIEPLEFPADPAIISTLISAFSTLSPVRTVVDSASDFSEYGLDNPSLIVELSAGLGAPQTLLLGDAIPTGSSHYAVARGRNRVFLVSNEIHNSFNKTTIALRDRLLLHIDQDKISEVTVRSNQSRNPLACELDSLGTWRVVSPFNMPAERNEAISLVSSIASMKAIDFIEDDPASLRKYGLDRPWATASVKSKDGTIDASIMLGKTENNITYAKSSEFNTVFALAPSRKNQLVRDQNLYRRLTAFDFRSYDVLKLDLQLDRELVSCVRRSFDDWRMMRPVETRADDKMITGLLDSLEVMKILEYLPASEANLKKYALQQPKVLLTCEIKDRQPRTRIAIGTVTDDGQAAYVRDVDEDWIYKVRATGLRHIPATATDVRDRQVLRYKGYEVNMFEVTRENHRVRVRRDQKQKTVWKLEEPFRGNADAVSVGKAFNALESVYTEIFVSDEADADMSRFGLDKPSMEITLLSGGRGKLAEERLSLLVGKVFPGDGSLVYVKRRNSPVVSLTKNTFLTELNQLIDNTVPAS